MQLTQFLIEPDVSIMEAMSRLDNSEHKILYVVNNEIKCKIKIKLFQTY